MIYGFRKEQFVKLWQLNFNCEYDIFCNIILTDRIVKFSVGSVSASVRMCVSVCVCVCMRVYGCVYVCMHICVCVCVFSLILVVQPH
jgi:hypothetical protein